jgi:hypothetical protein
LFPHLDEDGISMLPPMLAPALRFFVTRAGASSFGHEKEQAT